MSDEGMWGALIGIILFVVGALLIILFLGKSLLGFQGSFESTICKFNAWMRSNTVGNPLFQALAGAGEFLTGGMGGVVTSSMSIPLVCSKAPQLQVPDTGARISDVAVKLADEITNCWDQFGLGQWDPLILSREGQLFTCFEQTLFINCTRNDLIKLWDVSNNEIMILTDDSVFDKDLLYYYLRTKTYAFSGYDKTYADILKEGMPEMGAFGGMITCDGSLRKYYISINYIDYFSGGFPNQAVVGTGCGSKELKDERTDLIYLCVYEYGG